MIWPGYFNPRSPCGERQGGRGNEATKAIISTHAPRAGSDHPTFVSRPAALPFQPTLPVRGATMHPSGFPFGAGFQPTLPVRGATAVVFRLLFDVPISTHAPRAGSDFIFKASIIICKISTHAPRAGSDARSPRCVQAHGNFNPRSPCGERRGHSRSARLPH